MKDVSKLKKEFWDTIHNHNKVSISLLSEKDVVDYEMNGDIILVIHVPRAGRENKSVYINNDIWGGTFRRDWEGDYHCTRNSGSIRLGKKQMLKGGISQPRNKNLLKMFNLIGIGEHAGSGVPDIFDVWKEEDYEDPIVEELSGREGNPDRTIVTLPLVKKKSGPF